MSYNFTNTYTTQEGVVFDMDGATCPRCQGPSKLEHYHFTSMTSFLCPNCDLMYDEPAFPNAESQFITALDRDHLLELEEGNEWGEIHTKVCEYWELNPNDYQTDGKVTNVALLHEHANALPEI